MSPSTSGDKFRRLGLRERQETETSLKSKMGPVSFRRGPSSTTPRRGLGTRARRGGRTFGSVSRPPNIQAVGVFLPMVIAAAWRASGQVCPIDRDTSSTCSAAACVMTVTRQALGWLADALVGWLAGFTTSGSGRGGMASWIPDTVMPLASRFPDPISGPAPINGGAATASHHKQS